MQQYEEQEIIKAFKVYSKLAAKGLGEKDELREYLLDDRIRGLVDRFADEVHIETIALLQREIS